MSYISFSYYVFLLLLVGLYYVLPKKIRWLVLLAGSACFYYLLVDRRRRLVLFAGSVLFSYLWAFWFPAGLFFVSAWQIFSRTGFPEVLFWQR